MPNETPKVRLMFFAWKPTISSLPFACHAGCENAGSCD